MSFKRGSLYVVTERDCPPQVNLEYLGRVVFNENGLLYPDSVVGTDSHTTMINGLGVVGWGKYSLYVGGLV